VEKEGKNAGREIKRANTWSKSFTFSQTFGVIRLHRCVNRIMIEKYVSFLAINYLKKNTVYLMTAFRFGA
jgi:hypothetical protein